ncbi:MAG: response regulator [Gammaproteobacteria bacterium]|nr:response regulator [Gammaproteobacteria bacterium]
MNDPVRLLVIEDVNFSRQALVSMLTRFNCEVDSAANGYEAIEKVDDHHYNLIICDIHLPDMEGMMLTETLRQHHDDFFKTQALSSGINGLLQKPLTMDAAEALLKKWVGDKLSLPITSGE